MRKTSAGRTRFAAGPADRPRLWPPARRSLSPAFGLETLDQMGIDIDQDPRAFARFLEMKNRAQDRR
ncbi:hypothetical protein [Dongia sp.]|uniref:hypothetical protein n=1 Tax=Dongia sp. TaxID=1977262 RepID=UPI003750EC61